MNTDLRGIISQSTGDVFDTFQERLLKTAAVMIGSLNLMTFCLGSMLGASDSIQIDEFETAVSDYFFGYALNEEGNLDYTMALSSPETLFMGTIISYSWPGMEAGFAYAKKQQPSDTGSVSLQ